ncbi:hypothetical protein BELL_0347g00040 [Botrytis elliptica]|uniref:2EXR domain-containing protein n=1 Tax=Botrytis elliptica TaxID=278938 RepID=A0A4Z1JQV2_9HELO|nr:hypothetical protein EAE99_011453 [Botrytis elliptica]TGO73602.1 hypothetical protein BELL_0347g00040 [Botrytis elliptica]
MSSHSLSSFTLFPNLPLELQHQIWFYTLPGPRLLRIDYSPILSNGQYATTKSLDLYTTFPRSYGRQLPIILRINKASREYALTQLVERFNCYWNLKIDIPYIHAREYRKSEARFTVQYLAENGGLEGFRNLALDVDLLNGGESSDIISAVHSCPNLSNIFLAYPSIGIWDNPEGPDDVEPWYIGPPSEGEVKTVWGKSTMTRLSGDVMGYVKDSDRAKLENLEGRVEKLKIVMMVWSSMCTALREVEL